MNITHKTSLLVLLTCLTLCSLTAQAKGKKHRTKPRPAAQNKAAQNKRGADRQNDRPAWLTKMIDNLKAAPVANPPARIIKYRYQNQTVYYLPARCCDIPSQLLDEKGGMMCRPDGGMTGRGDGECADFSQARTDEQLIWQDTRKTGKRR